MRRRFGVPLTAALIVLVVMAQPYSPVEPYYLLIGGTTLWAVFDSIRLRTSEHGSSSFLSPVPLAVLMLIGWPLAFPWYLKVHHLVANGESADKAGSFFAIRMAFLGLLVVPALLLVVSGVIVMKYFPGVTQYLERTFLVSRALSEQFGGSVKFSVNTERELVITMGQERPNDAAANERFARQVARYAREHFPGADSLKTIEVVLTEQRGAGPVTVTSTHGRYKWTVAELSDDGGPARNSRAPQPTLASVTPAGRPTATPTLPASRPAPTRRPVSTHAFARLASADPAVRWVSDSAIVADIDCDGVADTVVIGRRRSEVHVGFARAADPEPQILIFDVGRNVKGAVCGTRARLALESLDWDPEERGISGLRGFRRSSTCKGVGLGDGDCRNVHIFWSHETTHVEWYQR